MGLRYKNAGVDIEAGTRLVDRIKPVVAATHRSGVVNPIGGFAGMMALPPGYQEPILVSGTDGVGTKLKTALATGRHQTIGIDLVAMCVNDILVTGAKPLFFLDYYATAALDVDVAESVITGIADGCAQCDCSLIGGETAEMPGLYQNGDYDLAGFCVGVVERAEIHNGDTLRTNDLIIGLPSSGLHANGHSLARKVLLEELSLSFEDTPDILAGQCVADVLLEPTLLYSRAFEALRTGEVPWKCAAHITGGGLIDNPPRMLTSPVFDLHLHPTRWSEPPVFELIAGVGIDKDEMRHTFNMGLGMLIAIDPTHAENALSVLRQHGYPSNVVGELAPGTGQVVFT